MYMEKDYSVIAYIGRFQPFHLGHKAVIDQALLLADKVVVVIGSAGGPRTVKNPWTASERIQMISSTFTEEELARISFVEQEDHLYNFERWLAEVTTAVENINRANIAKGKHRNGPYKIGLIGVDKDASSFYLKHFPQWDTISFTPTKIVNATDVRRLYFDVAMTDAERSTAIQDVAVSLDTPIARWLSRWKNTHAQDFHNIAEEWAFIQKYKEGWANAPYAPTFYTADALVICSGHVLLIGRKDRPGRGLLALPGGFVNQTETAQEAAIRELREETKIKVPPAALLGSIDKERVFDYPDRSMRGRTVTYVYRLMLPNDKLPGVVGADDAADARWVPRADLRRDQMFEDHYDIIEYMMGF